QAVIAAPGFEAEPKALCRALKVGRIDLTHVPPGQSLLPRRAGQHGSWIAEIGEGAEAYRAQQKAVRKDFVRQTHQKPRKLEKDLGAPVFSALSTDALHFETLLCWKLEQLERSNQPPIWSAPWVRAVLDRAFASQNPDFRGAMFTLCVGGELIAANFCLA